MQKENRRSEKKMKETHRKNCGKALADIVRRAN